MDWVQIEQELAGVAERLSIEIRHLRYEGEGGMCVIRGKKVLMINDGLDAPDRVFMMARALVGAPGVEDLYVVPEVRELLDKYAPRTSKD